jgi:hypothetical protein
MAFDGCTPWEVPEAASDEAVAFLLLFFEGFSVPLALAWPLETTSLFSTLSSDFAAGRADGSA